MKTLKPQQFRRIHPRHCAEQVQRKAVDEGDFSERFSLHLNQITVDFLSEIVYDFRRIVK